MSRDMGTQSVRHPTSVPRELAGNEPRLLGTARPPRRWALPPRILLVAALSLTAGGCARKLAGLYNEANTVLLMRNEGMDDAEYALVGLGAHGETNNDRTLYAAIIRTVFLYRGRLHPINIQFYYSANRDRWTFRDFLYEEQAVRRQYEKQDNGRKPADATPSGVKDIRELRGRYQQRADELRRGRPLEMLGIDERVKYDAFMNRIRALHRKEVNLLNKQESR